MAGCESSNWYIRKNASETLTNTVDPTLAKFIAVNEEDRYARDMMNYNLKRKQEENHDGCN